MVRRIIIAMLIVMQAVFGAPDYLLDAGNYWGRALSYSFFHGSWWHLAVNCVAIWTMYPPKRKFDPAQMLVAYAIAVIVYPISFRPVIGFSNILYATLGLRTPSLKSTWWKRPAVLVFLAITLAMVFIPRFSATTHIAAFLLGIACASFRRSWLKLSEDARRYY